MGSTSTTQLSWEGWSSCRPSRSPMHTSPTPPRWPQPRKRSTPPSRPPRWGSTQRLPQSTTTFRAQIANAYLDDTEDVAVAKAAHMTAIEEAAAAAAAMEPREVKMATPIVYQQPLMYYQIPHYMPIYNGFG